MSKWAKSKDELGYFSEGNPTDKQLQFQDEVDNAIHRFLGTLNGIYKHYQDVEHPDTEWDIEKISRIREEAEKVLELPDMY